MVGISPEADQERYCRPQLVTFEVFLINFVPVTIEVQVDESLFTLSDPAGRDVAQRAFIIDFVDPTRTIPPSGRVHLIDSNWDLRETPLAHRWDAGRYTTFLKASSPDDTFSVGETSFCVGPETLCPPPPDPATPFRIAGIVVLILVVGITAVIALYYRVRPARSKRER